MLTPKHLVFAGGGPRCLAFLGSVDFLTTKNMFQNVSDYWGNSAGALLATFLSLKTPLPKLKSVFEELDFTRFRDIDLGNIVSFGEKWGLDSGEAFFIEMKKLLENIKPGSSHYKLQDLPGLHIAAADLTDTQMVILDAKSFPELKLIDALRATTSIPFFYRPFRNPINNHLLVDGAVGMNFPWALLPSDEDRKSALGFNFKIYSDSDEPKSLSEFIPKILNFKESCRQKIGSKNIIVEPNIIYFHIQGYPPWHLSIKQQDRAHLFSTGRAITETWFTSHFPEGRLVMRHECGDQRTQLPYPHSSKQLLGTHECLLQPPHQAVSQDSPSLCLRPCRRWSV